MNTAWTCWEPFKITESDAEDASDPSQIIDSFEELMSTLTLIEIKKNQIYDLNGPLYVLVLCFFVLRGRVFNIDTAVG